MVTRDGTTIISLRKAEWLWLADVKNQHISKNFRKGSKLVFNYSNKILDL